MDAVQFGRWMSERRRACGWPSQRALVEAMRHDSLLSEYSISEDFLARLEAGHLAHPFRGSVRRRVLALPWLLCKTTRDLQRYLRAAELTELSTEETEQLQRLYAYLLARDAPQQLLLPPRPTRLEGRTFELDRLLHALCVPEASLCAVTGMPGIGKSALAYEAVHLLATNERERLLLFPNGIATFTCSGRRGASGLISLLKEITLVFRSSETPATKKSTGSTATGKHRSPLHHEEQLVSVDSRLIVDTTAELASALDSARAALAGKRVLLLLDDVDASFPLRQAVEALTQTSLPGRNGLQAGYRISLNSRGEGVGKSESAGERRVILSTSRYVPAPALVSYHLHMAPLQPDAALALLTNLVGRPFVGVERSYAEHVCAAVGHLPQAIEMAATAVIAGGIPLSLLAGRVAENPLDRLLDSEQEMHSILAQAIDVLEPAMQERFVLLSTLGTQSFELESAAQTTNCTPTQDTRPESGNIPLACLANTAADLGQFVRYSLLDLAPEETGATASPPQRNFRESKPSSTARYKMHPLLHAYAIEHLSWIQTDSTDMNRHPIQFTSGELRRRYVR